LLSGPPIAHRYRRSQKSKPDCHLKIPGNWNRAGREQFVPVARVLRSGSRLRRRALTISIDPPKERRSIYVTSNYYLPLRLRYCRNRLSFDDFNRRLGLSRSWRRSSRRRLPWRRLSWSVSRWRLSRLSCRRLSRCGSRSSDRRRSCRCRRRRIRGLRRLSLRLLSLWALLLRLEELCRAQYKLCARQAIVARFRYRRRRKMRGDPSLRRLPRDQKPDVRGAGK